MKGFTTTYSQMFEPSGDEERQDVTSIEIPLIQRDYAQGRDDAAAATIRHEFLAALVGALTGDEPIGLDFVYGEVSSEGVLKPLDGQQRLTTLFLLHWYVASRAGTLDRQAAWGALRYATRMSAEHFCTELVRHTWKLEEGDPVDWITDQPWYLFPWRTDPTIQSMLVMIRSIHAALSAETHDFSVLWDRLTSDRDAPISFLFLPIDDLVSGDDLYIKMNSRGKPLTDFEVFKARLEKVLSVTGRQEEFSARVDREWSDVLWHYEGGNYLVDDKFLRYFEFVVDVCEWRSGGTRSSGNLIDRARDMFVDHADSTSHLDFLFHAFDTWVGKHPAEDLPATVFRGLFRTERDEGSGLLLFESQNTNLFGACLENYGTSRFTLAETILLFAVLVSRQLRPEASPDDLSSRLRRLRNLAESAPDDVRSEYMAELIASAGSVMTKPVDSHLVGLTRFNVARVADEELKRTQIGQHPNMHGPLLALEDHDLLRGRLFAFELDHATLEPQSRVFAQAASHENLALFSRALLTKGDYSRQVGNKRQFGVQAGTRGGGSWREVLTLGARDSRLELRTSLGKLLTDLVQRGGPVAPAMELVVAEWLSERAGSGEFDWRYYFVRYPVMLTAPRGVYSIAQPPKSSRYGYRIDMLNGTDYRSVFTDPYLLAVWDACGRPSDLERPEFRSWDGSGAERSMLLDRSGTGIRTTDRGYEVLPPDDPALAHRVAAVLDVFGASDGIVVVGPHQRTADEVDAFDRVALGVRVVSAMLEVGL